MRLALSAALIVSTVSSGAQAFSIGNPCSPTKNGGTIAIIETRLFGTVASSSVSTTAVPDETNTVVEDNEVDDYDDVTPSYIISKLLFGGNLGLGLDIGFSHHLNKQVTITGSLQDVGFIYNTQNVESHKADGNYTIEGINLIFDEDNPDEYWNNIQDDFESSIGLDSIYSNYISTRPLKVNGSISYSFGQRYDDCRFLVEKDVYTNKIGFHLFAAPGVVHTYMSGTVF